MTNNRVFFAVHAVSIAPHNSTTFTKTFGVQSVSVNTSFNLEQVFELGQIAIYENIEDIPDVEVTIEKVLDGHPLIYHLATRGSASSTLSGRSNSRSNVVLGIYGDTQDSASGVAVSEVHMSGMYVSSLNYTLPVDGNCTESVTLIGNHKVWRADNYLQGTSAYDNTDTPLNVTDSGGVQRRENVLFDVNQGIGDSATPDGTLLPGGTSGIEGISSSGVNVKTNDVYGAHIQQITISSDLGREAINELGRRNPYFRFVNFPVEVTCEIETISVQGDQVSANETGYAGGGNNLQDKRIFVALQDSTKFDLGTSNKLASVTYGGGDTGGGQATSTYTYTTFNDLTITQAQDPG